MFVSIPFQALFFFRYDNSEYNVKVEFMLHITIVDPTFVVVVKG